MLAFIVKLVWVNETKSFESVLKTRHLSLLIDILTFRAASVTTNINPEKFKMSIRPVSKFCQRARVNISL